MNWCTMKDELITLHAKLSGIMYCYRSSVFVCLFVGGWVCYHDNSKLRASILTKLGLQMKVVTISSWLNFGRPAPPGRGQWQGENFLAPPYYSQRAMFASLWALFSLLNVEVCTRRPLDTPVQRRWPRLSCGRGPCEEHTVCWSHPSSLLAFKRRLNTVLLAQSYPSRQFRTRLTFCLLSLALLTRPFSISVVERVPAVSDIAPP